MEKYINYNDLLDTLFKQWENSYDEVERNKFCNDGLMLIPDNPNPDNLSYVDELWEKSERRVLFLLKDSPDGEKDDIRRWLIKNEACRNLTGLIGQTGFLPNIAMMLYGLMITKKEYRLGYSEVLETKMDEVKKMWNSTPFALVESKKVAGHSDVKDKEVADAIKRDAVFLKKELDILKPNIIVCCGKPQFAFVTENYLKGKDHEEFVAQNYPDKRNYGCLWYYSKEGIAVIKSHHPTNRGKGKEKWKIYERVISPFGGLMNERNPDFG